MKVYELSRFWNNNNMHILAELAKNAVEEYFKNGTTIKTEDMSKEWLRREAGVFVTIESNKKLRGCIGTYLPTQKNIAEEIIHNAISAATEDFRFEKITPKELPSLKYTISILSEPKLIKNIEELDPKKYGIIVKSANFKTGLLLPDLPDINDIEDQIDIACKKAGISFADGQISIYKFTVEKYQ